MSEEEKGASGAPDQVSSAPDQEIGQVSSGNQDTVKYDTYRKTLSEAKKARAQMTEMAERLQVMEQEKLQAEGKVQELLQSVTAERDELKSKLANAHGSFARGKAMDVIVDEANKMGVASTGLLRKAVEDKIMDLDFDDEYRPNSEQVKMILEDLRKEEPFLFSKAAPSVANHNVNPGGGVPGQKTLSTMSDDEINEKWASLPTKR